MSEPLADLQSIWDQFLARWPLEKMPQLTLAEYTAAGTNDSFAYWLEMKTDKLGSFWGGSAFKFGIFSRKASEKRENGGGASYTDDYAWYSKYGDSVDGAFTQVRALVVQVATAAREGRFEAIDDIDLGPAFKWKLAFLYQDRANPVVLPILRPEVLRHEIGELAKGWPASRLHRHLSALRGAQSIFEQAAVIWGRYQEWLSQQFSVAMAQEWLQNCGLFTPIKDPTKYAAGFQLDDGRQLALIRNVQNVTIFLVPGDWLEQVQDKLEAITPYRADATRHSNLGANAPLLATGHEAMSVKVPTLEALVALAEAYAGSPSHLAEPAARYQEPRMDTTKAVSLNQILFGPPGTGKTYATIDAALEVLDPECLRSNPGDEGRAARKRRFDKLVEEKQIRFVTFHQSFSYEDFVEGLRAEKGEDGQLSYDVEEGIFKQICGAAAARVTRQASENIELEGRRIWKMSLGNTQGSDAYIYNECIDNNYVLLGYGGSADFKGCASREEIYKRFVETEEDVEQKSYAVTSVAMFVLKMKPGDLVLVTDGNLKFRAIGEVTGEYRSLKRDDYGQCRDVKWLRVYKPSLPYDQVMNNKFSQATIYELKPGAIDMEKLANLLGTQGSMLAEDVSASGLFQVGEKFGSDYQVLYASADVLELEKPNGNRLPIGMSLLRTLAEYVKKGAITVEDIRKKAILEKLPGSKLEPNLVNGYSNILGMLVERMLVGSQGAMSAKAPPNARVLIIDEINRGNISRIFGELITLIEPSKRAGASEALEVTLPYSKETFSVPGNLYLIGTMNTADRSLAGLDIALRRRFIFREMSPRPELLDGVTVEGIDTGALLRVLNQRIEVLLDRDHCLGHAYFLPLKDDRAFTRLAAIFRDQILPLLQEYFFEDWERIRWVLNDQNAPAGLPTFIQRSVAAENLQKLFGSAAQELGNPARWELNPEAFANVASFRNILGAA